MLHLTTGGNGAGKTLLTLKHVRDLSVKEGRPVCYNGRFEIVEGGELSSWKKIDFNDWQKEPDGTIFVIDECHNDMPVRSASAAVPEPIKMLAEHRRRGMDFFLLTQHPQNIDNFVRRLIASPGWHRHFKRTFGADLVSCIEWSAVNPNCEKPGSGKSGTVTMIGYPKEVYSWYRSASLHTGKTKIPRAVWVAIGCAVLVPVMGYMAYKVMWDNATKRLPEQAKTTHQIGPGQAGGSVSAVHTLTAAEYVQHRKPRLDDFAHTAPAYDEVTKPTVAPYPAACVYMPSKGCECYTQQATVMRVSESTCMQIVKRGFFVDWQLPQHAPSQQPRQEAAKQVMVQGPVSMPQQPVQVAQMAQQQPQQDGFTQGLQARNAQVRSTVSR